MKDHSDWLTKTGGFARDMTLRDYYAGLAMQAMMTKGFWNWENPSENIARVHAQASAMIREQCQILKELDGAYIRVVNKVDTDPYVDTIGEFKSLLALLLVLVGMVMLAFAIWGKP